MSTNSPQQRPATLAESLSVLKARHWEVFSPAERRELRDAIIALTVTESLQSEIAPTQNGHESTQNGHDDKSDTPRTDEVQDWDNLTLCLKLRNLCRQLERELNAARSAIGTTSTRSDK